VRGGRAALRAGAPGAVLLAAMWLLATPGRAAAQEEGTLFDRLYLDRLRLSSLSVAAGPVKPSKMHATQVYAIQADYGEIAPRWRVGFSIAYWGSRYTDAVVQTLADSLRHLVVDPARDDTLQLGRVTVSDLAVGMDMRWSPRTGALRPYVAGGLLAHVLNAEGRLINGTFLENALDNIAAGVAAAVGVDVTLARHLGLGLEARYDLTSGVRFGSMRAVGSYHFDRAPQALPR
jgi:hypothetical protein